MKCIVIPKLGPATPIGAGVRVGLGDGGATVALGGWLAAARVGAGGGGRRGAGRRGGLCGGGGRRRGGGGGTTGRRRGRTAGAQEDGGEKQPGVRQKCSPCDEPGRRTGRIGRYRVAAAYACHET